MAVPSEGGMTVPEGAARVVEVPTGAHEVLPQGAAPAPGPVVARGGRVVQRGGEAVLAHGPMLIEFDPLCPTGVSASPNPAQWGQQVTLTAIVGTFGLQTQASSVALIEVAKPTQATSLPIDSWSTGEVVVTLPANSPNPALPTSAWALSFHVEGATLACAPVPIAIGLPVPPTGSQVVEPPVMLALFDNDHPLWLFLMVPSDSPLPQVLNPQGGNPIPSGLGVPAGGWVGGALSATLGSLSGDTAGLSEAFGEITSLLSNPSARVIITKGDQAPDLHDFLFDTGFAWYGTAEDAMDRLIFIAPPGWSASCYNDKSMNPDQGEFTVTTGTARFVRVDSLKSVTASSDPSAGTVAINRSPGGFVFPQGQISDFQDELSSLQLIPPS